MPIVCVPFLAPKGGGEEREGPAARWKGGEERPKGSWGQIRIALDVQLTNNFSLAFFSELCTAESLGQLQVEIEPSLKEMAASIKTFPPNGCSDMCFFLSVFLFISCLVALQQQEKQRDTRKGIMIVVVMRSHELPGRRP